MRRSCSSSSNNNSSSSSSISGDGMKMSTSATIIHIAIDFHLVSVDQSAICGVTSARDSDIGQLHVLLFDSPNCGAEWYW